MSGVLAGAALGATSGAGLLLVAARLQARRTSSVEDRVRPYLRDLAVTRAVPASRSVGGETGAGDLVRTALGRVGDGVERVLGGSAAVQRRIDRAALDLTVHEFRIEQAVWGVVAFAVAAVPSAFLALRRPDRAVPLLVLCLAALALGVLLRENRLSAQVARRERRVLEELPVIAELLALAVAAGESPVAALDRVVRRASGEFARDLAAMLAQVRTGTPLTLALDQVALRSGLAAVSRFAQGMAVAVERGTPLAEVLHAQAADVRDAARRALIETGARREVLMMVPVVFLVLPTVIVFAFWPGLVGLHLTV